MYLLGKTKLSTRFEVLYKIFEIWANIKGKIKKWHLKVKMLDWIKIF